MASINYITAFYMNRNIDYNKNKILRGMRLRLNKIK